MIKLKSFSLFGLILVAAACGGRSTSNNVGNGSNTNWLSGCNTDAKCGDGICAGGACTETCRNDDDCEHLSPDAKCAEAVPFVSSGSAACDDAEPRRVCTLGCEDQSACEDIGDGYTCTDGACVPAACVNPSPSSACEDKACGEYCTPCPPSDPQCEVDAIVYQCSAEGACVPGVLACGDEDCSAIPANECEAYGCVVIDGHAVTGECSDWTLTPVGCAPSDSGDSAISCALNPEDSLCYQFPTTTSPSGWPTVSCEDTRCVLPECPTAECFSPTRNVDRAYDGDIPGCACNNDEGDVCVGSAGLVCSEDGRWMAVEDGPCYPIDTPCRGELADPYECIALFELCVEQGDSFCGVTSLTALCPLGVIVDSETDCASDATECTKLDNGLWCASSVAPPDDACFSPTENLDRASDGDIPGCPCSEDQGDICVGGGGLSCDDGKWNAVVDGPCYPLDLPCLGLIEDPYACIELFGNCTQYGDVFCGDGPLTQQCADGVLVENAFDCPTAAADCTQLESGLWCASPLTSPCPEHYHYVESCEGALCVNTSPSITCQLSSIGLEECTSSGGVAVEGALDGGLADGCPPEYGPAIGILWLGLCCSPLDASDAGAPNAETADASAEN